MQSIWEKETPIPQAPCLAHDLQVPAVIIGGGMAGILTGYLLKRRGVHAVILEASRIGSGQTSKTTAKITCQHGLIYARLLESFGIEQARAYAAANQDAIGQYEEIVRRENIGCGFERCAACLYTNEDPQVLEREYEAVCRCGINAEVTAQTELPFDVKSALYYENQAKFHPLAFLSAVCRDLEIYEDTRVLRVDNQDVVTQRGTVHAQHIVFAAHFPFVNTPGFYFMRLHQQRSYAIALEGAEPPHAMYYGVDEGGLSLRGAGKTLLLGGAGHRTGENRTGGSYQALRAAAKKWYPQARETAAWSAQDCMPLDGVPYIGRFSPSRPHWYVQTGFQKWGMSTSMVAAQMVCGLITGQESPHGSVFDPSRQTFSASAKTLMENTVKSAQSLSRELLAPPRAQLDELLPGHGGIVEYDGHKAGVYKNEEGEVFVVHPRCPHLGCQLEWNPDEKSWDCPCHGSRFDYQGRLLDNPAQEGLAHA